MKRLKVFYSQPMDFLTKASIRQRLRTLRNRTKPLAVEIVAPYEDEKERDLHQNPMSRREAQDIVKKNLDALGTSDMLVANVSQENRQAIGMLFEIAHARFLNKFIVIYAGKSSIGKQLWIQAYANVICSSWNEVVDTIHQRIQVRDLDRNGRTSVAAIAPDSAR